MSVRADSNGWVRFWCVSPSPVNGARETSKMEDGAVRECEGRAGGRSEVRVQGKKGGGGG